MPERTGYKHGVPSWVDLGTTDVEGAKAFYSGLFGWTFEDLPMDMGMAYTMFSKDGKAVAGGGPLPQEIAARGEPSRWQSYINVDSVDETVAKVEAAGGGVMIPAMDVMTSGRMAFITDPAGGAIGLWQAGDHIGAELVNETGALTWNELMTDDPTTVQQFFADAIGWDAQIEEIPQGDYTFFKVGDDMIAGMMQKTPDMGQVPNYWNIYFGVADCESDAARITELGGTVIAQPFDTQVGKIAVVQDPQGAVFSIIQPNQPSE